VRNPKVAAVLSAIFPGLGQFYNRQWFKGFGFFIASGMLTQLMAEQVSVEDILRGNQSGLAKELVLLLVLLCLLVWSMWDAYRSAKASSPKE